MRGEDERRESARRSVDRIGRGKYAPGAMEEVTLPVDEGREAHERDIEDPADRARDPDVLRDGGPARNRGVSTTTGTERRAGPANVRRQPRRPGGKVAPTTTGDATTGGINPSAAGSTSDASGQSRQIGNFTDK
ncbi:hypothetical protein [Plantactinospora endophytica]|uniref:Phosphatidylethanolamine-binding protein n=1 Tax=Plantactinospora endophytica TaxID=673535 RepID=A0ABQ4EA47_9ACTN|nr:hypothetical protein [Plantactinospora endophytica]GIG91601.1 hypothetical protein Pen02_65370 [Plantactinospora endophytica]